MKNLIMGMLVFLLAIGMANDIQAQDTDLVPDDTLRGWIVNWVANLNGSQVFYSNWSKGGVNSISVAGSSQFTGVYRKRDFSYGLRIRTNYGQARIQDEGVRKTDDRTSFRNRCELLQQIGRTY